MPTAIAPTDTPPRVIRAGHLSKDGKVVLIAIGPDNRERYTVHVPTGNETQVELVSELMWRDTEDTFPGTVSPPYRARASVGARAPLSLVAQGDAEATSAEREALAG